MSDVYTGEPASLNLYTVYDVIAEDSCPPFLAPNDGVAKRQFASLLRDTINPNDYRLYKVGVWFPKKMTLESLVPSEVFTTEL